MKKTRVSKAQMPVGVKTPEFTHDGSFMNYSASQVNGSSVRVKVSLDSHRYGTKVYYRFNAVAEIGERSIAKYGEPPSYRNHDFTEDGPWDSKAEQIAFKEGLMSTRLRPEYRVVDAGALEFLISKR